MDALKTPRVKPQDEALAFIPEEAIAHSEQGRRPPVSELRPVLPAADEYGEERVATGTPTPEQVRTTVPDTTVEGG